MKRQAKMKVKTEENIFVDSSPAYLCTIFKYVMIQFFLILRAQILINAIEIFKNRVLLIVSTRHFTNSQER